MGGSATVDWGAVIIRALGIRYLNAKGEALQSIPENMNKLTAVDLSEMDKRMFTCSLTVLCDVDNLLLGKEGAAAVFGPQKGATPEGVFRLEAALQRLQEVALRQTGRDMASVKYGGTAGGAAAGLFAFLHAKLVNGIDQFLQMTGFGEALLKTDLVITGEGSVDKQTLQGKGPYGVASRAKQKGIPVIALAGSVPLREDDGLTACFDVLLAIGNGPEAVSAAMKTTAENLTRTSTAVGNLLALP
jgi:glycerate kinase